MATNPGALGGTALEQKDYRTLKWIADSSEIRSRKFIVGGTASAAVNIPALSIMVQADDGTVSAYAAPAGSAKLPGDAAGISANGLASKLIPGFIGLSMPTGNEKVIFEEAPLDLRSGLQPFTGSGGSTITVYTHGDFNSNAVADRPALLAKHFTDATAGGNTNNAAAKTIRANALLDNLETNEITAIATSGISFIAVS